MKKVILLALTALLVLSSFTACGSKDNGDAESSAESRVLYDDNSLAEERFENEISSEEESSDSSEKSSDTKLETKKKKVVATTSSEASSASSSAASSKKKTVTTSSVSSQNTTASSTASSQKPTGTTTTTTVSNTPADSQSQTTTSVNESTSSASSENSETPDTDTVSSEPTEKTGSFDESDLTAVFDSGKVNFGDDIESVKPILGEPVDVQEAPSCKYTGQLDKTFIFNECSINTYPNEDGSKDYVVGIVITSGDYTTAKGAKIGTTSEELIAIYGNSEDDEAPMRKYTIGDKILSFYVEGDAVAEINYIWNN